MSNVPLLGVPLMDRDHQTLDAMFERLPTTADGDLPALFAAIDAETRAHFAREETLFAEVPIAHCHLAQHALVLGEFEAAAARIATLDAAALRTLIGVTLREMIVGHVGSVDLVTSQFLGGHMTADATANLRLPERPGCPV